MLQLEDDITFSERAKERLRLKEREIDRQTHRQTHRQTKREKERDGWGEGRVKHYQRETKRQKMKNGYGCGDEDTNCRTHRKVTSDENSGKLKSHKTRV